MVPSGTGARLSEIARLRTVEIDRPGRALRFSDTKEHESIRPLAQPALDVIDDLTKSISRKGCSYLLPGTSGNRPYGGMPGAIERIMSRRPELAGVTAHTLRHSFGSVADELGYTEATVGAMLGHGVGSTVTRGYIHHLDRVLISAADRVAAHIEAAMNGKAAAEGVDLPG